MNFPAAEAVCRVDRPLDWSAGKIALMVDACREMAIFHARECAEIAWLYRRHGFDPESVRSEADLTRIPMLGVTAMKHYLVTSIPHERAVLKLTSSGTGGQKTQIWFDEASLARVQAQMDGLWGQEGLVSDEPTNYCAFIYDPDDAADLGISFSVRNEERFAPVKRSYFTVRKNTRGDWEYDRGKAEAMLREFAAEGVPVRLLGIPSFAFELILALEGKAPIALPPGSWLLTGGGWKAAEDKKIPREAFRALVTERLGIPDAKIRDGFGMAEHSAPYIECDRHRFHVPVYNRVFARDPVSLRPLPPGHTGLLELMTPFNAMMPTTAILTTDLGYVDAGACDCGRNSPTFTLVGRGGTAKHKGCAITAAEIVRREGV